MWGFFLRCQGRKEIRDTAGNSDATGSGQGRERRARGEREKPCRAEIRGGFCGCELVEGKAGMIGGKWGLSVVDLHSDRGRIRRQTLPARSAGEGVRRRKCRRGDRRPDREERRMFPGCHVAPLKQSHGGAPASPPFVSVDTCPASPGCLRSVWGSCRRRRGHLLAPRPLRRRLTACGRGGVIGRSVWQVRRQRRARRQPFAVAGCSPGRAPRYKSHHHGPNAGQEVRGGLLRNVKVCGGNAVKVIRRFCTTYLQRSSVG